MEDIPPPLTTMKAKNLELLEAKDFTLNFNKDIFQVKIGKDIEKKYIIIKISKISELVDVFYENKFNFDELVKFDKTFRAYDELDEIYFILVAFFNEKKVLINEVKNEEITLTIKILPITGKEKKVDIKLYKKELEKDSIIK